MLAGISILLITTVVLDGKCSPWVMLSQPYLECCVFGCDNLPLTLLMYFNNVILSQEAYFHSIICNSPEFKNTTINSDLRFMIWDNPPKMDPLFLNSSDFDHMVQSRVSQDSLKRMSCSGHGRCAYSPMCGPSRAAPGVWCTGRKSWLMDPCSQGAVVNGLKAGPRAKKPEDFIMNLVDDMKSQLDQCK